MKNFLREYAARNILSHLSSSGNRDSSVSANWLDNPSNQNNSSASSSIDALYNNSSDYYFIAAQQLLNTTSNDSGSSGGSSIGDGNSNVAVGSQRANVLMLASLAVTTAASETARHLSTPLYDGSDGLYYESYGHYSNFSCDGEAISGGAKLHYNASVGDAGGGGEGDESPLSSVYFKTAVYLLYIPIFVFALLGNGTVCYIVQSTPRMRTVTNYFIANLAVGDILMSLFCVPSSFVSMFILGYWPFGIALCYLVNYSQAVSVLVSAYTLVAISIDRYIAIMWPLRPRITKRYAKLIIAGVWSIALATAFPIPIVSTLKQPDDWHVYCERYVCQETWPTPMQSYYYTLALSILQFVLPLAVLIFTYTRIAFVVWGKRPPGEAENSRDQRMARSKRKLVDWYIFKNIIDKVKSTGLRSLHVKRGVLLILLDFTFQSSIFYNTLYVLFPKTNVK